MVNNVIGSEYGMPEITVYSGFNINEDLITKCRALDKQFYGDWVSTPLSKFEEWINISSFFCFVFVNNKTKQPIGYFYAFPVSDESIKKYLSGELKYENFSDKDYSSVVNEGAFNLHFNSIGFLKEYHTPQMARMLFDLLIEALLEKAKRNMFLNFFLLEKLSDFEQNIINLTGAQLISEKNKQQFYGGTFTPSKFKKLKRYEVLEYAYSTKAAIKYLLENKNSGN